MLNDPPKGSQNLQDFVKKYLQSKFTADEYKAREAELNNLTKCCRDRR
jgi:hypothetical protein